MDIDPKGLYKDFEKLHPIDTTRVDPPRMDILADCMTDFSGDRTYYAPAIFPFMMPMEYTGWRDEQLAWQLTCAFSVNINSGEFLEIKGPDATTFLKKYLVHDFEKFPIGTSKFGLQLATNGDVCSIGVIIRTAEDAYETFWLELKSFFEADMAKEPFDATLTDRTGKIYIFQLMGPRSLEILEDLTGDDLHDVKYATFRDSAIDGKKVRIYRFGMSNGLGYEIHGDRSDAPDVYRKVIEIGNAYGIRRLGLIAYMSSHTPGGYQQGQYQRHHEPPIDYLTNILAGSAGPDMDKRYMNPYELGLGHVVNFNHDFIGKEALLAYLKDTGPKRTLVTLEWNAEDIADIYHSQFRDEVPYSPIDMMVPTDHGGYRGDTMDLIFDTNGKEIGISGGRTISYFHRVMLSFGYIEEEYTSLGTDVVVLWGNVGSRQKEIRAKVVPTPYNTRFDNRTFDVEAITHRYPKK